MTAADRHTTSKLYSLIFGETGSDSEMRQSLQSPSIRFQPINMFICIGWLHRKEISLQSCENGKAQRMNGLTDDRGSDTDGNEQITYVTEERISIFFYPLPKPIQTKHWQKDNFPSPLQLQLDLRLYFHNLNILSSLPSHSCRPLHLTSSLTFLSFLPISYRQLQPFHSLSSVLHISLSLLQHQCTDPSSTLPFLSVSLALILSFIFSCQVSSRCPLSLSPSSIRSFTLSLWPSN